MLLTCVSLLRNSVEGLDLVFEQMTLIRKQEMTVVLVEYLKGSGQVNGSGKFLHAPVPFRTRCHILMCFLSVLVWSDFL